MRLPAPRSLLVEHPALPLPFEPSDDPPPTVPMADIDEAGRWRIAAQLVAASALLADAELWPGRWALRRARVERTEVGLQARLPALPVPLARIWTKLGGGEPAAHRARSAVLSEVSALTELELPIPGRDDSEPGFFLDGVLARILEIVGLPLDRATAESLWLWRWALPPLPEPGDTGLFAVTDESVARRVGAAMWAAARRQGRGATLVLVGHRGSARSIAEDRGAAPLRVLAGTFDHADMAELVDRSGGRGDATVAIGRLPDGWNAVPAPIFDPALLSGHLFLVGVSPARRRRLIEDLVGRFGPSSTGDRRWLTGSAATLFSKRQSRRSARHTELVRVAGLAPEGVPVPLALELAGTDTAELASACQAAAVLVRGDRVMLPLSIPLTVDPRHADIAADLAADDPRRILHNALATGDTGAVLAWSRRQLDDLRAAEVRRLLSNLAPGALGVGVQTALAEACLGLGDIHGARRALEGADSELTRPWSDWLRLLDRCPEHEAPRPRPLDLRHAPRACAEIALVSLRRAIERDPNAAGTPLEEIRQTLPYLHGANRKWIEIRLAARIEPERLDDREWRRSITGGHPELVGLLLFERSLRATFEGDRRLARRLLRRAMTAERAPGRLALMQINLGGLEADDGRSNTSEALTLGAYRLFQAAGFRRRGWEALYNLAVADIDQLRVDRAARRLDELARIDDSIFVELERTRLALAVGDLDRFRARLAARPHELDSSGAQVAEALSFLRGVERLLAGAPADAVVLLRRGGPEGSSWLELALAAAGECSDAREASPDGWGVARAAALLRQLRRGDFTHGQGGDGGDGMSPRIALSVALCHRFGGRRGWPEHDLRVLAARSLAEHGMTGWADRLRWSRSNVNGLLRGLSTVIRNQGSPPPEGPSHEGFLPALGVEGLVIRDARARRDLLRTGNGVPGPAVSRGPIEVIPLGGAPTDGPAWGLLLDLVGLAFDSREVAASDPTEQEVRVDGVSSAVARLRGEIRRVAGPQFTVLVLGETGSGKEVVAKELHRLSDRPGELVAVNIAAIPPNLLDAELFGSVKGAYTGAERSRRGLAAMADGGTLFLDEVGDLDAALQVKLLRFLESGEVRAVGADQPRRLDVRVICATHRNLDRRVREGRFRRDLYYRIAVARLQVPALRERPEDIPVLRSIFEREAARRHGLSVSSWTAAAERSLIRHRWPGNVRELKYTIEVAMARAAGDTIRPDHLPFADIEPSIGGSWDNALGEFKRRLLTDVLRRHRGNRSAAARELGISRQALLYQIKKLELRHL